MHDVCNKTSQEVTEIGMTGETPPRDSQVFSLARKRDQNEDPADPPYLTYGIMTHRDILS